MKTEKLFSEEEAKQIGKKLGIKWDKFDKEEVLPTIIEWMERRKRPFTFNTQASIELSDHKDLMQHDQSYSFSGHCL